MGQFVLPCLMNTNHTTIRVSTRFGLSMDNEQAGIGGDGRTRLTRPCSQARTETGETKIPVQLSTSKFVGKFCTREDVCISLTPLLQIRVQSTYECRSNADVCISLTPLLPILVQHPWAYLINCSLNYYHISPHTRFGEGGGQLDR